MDDKALLEDLDHAETVMEEHPDSAYMLLVAHDSLMVSQQSRNTRMRYQLLMTEALNKLYQPLPTDSLFQLVVDYYDAHGIPNQQLKAHYLLGCIHRDRGEAPQALQCYCDAIEKADTLKDDCDYITLFSVYGQMADVFEAQVMPDEGIEALKQYSKYAWKAGNTYEYIRGIEFMAAACNLKRDTVGILSNEQKAFNLYKKYGFEQAAASAFMMSTYIYIARGDYEKAKQLMQTFETESGLFDSNGNISNGREHYYDTKGLYYLGVGQLDSAEHEFKRLIPYGYTFDAYRGLLAVSQKRKDASAVLLYTKLYEASFDTLVTNIHAQATRQVAGMYDYTRHQRIALEKTAESERNRNIIYILIIIVVIVASLFYHLYRSAREKKKREIERLSHQYMNVLTQYEQVQEEMNMLETDFSAFQQRKQEELSDLQSQLSEFQDRYGNLRQKEKLEALKQSPIWESIIERLNPKKKSKPVTDKEWEKLSILFTQCVPALYALMTENKPLNLHEQRVTMLTRLGLSTKDIAILLETFPQRVTNARESANNKLFSDPSARTFLENICKL